MKTRSRIDREPDFDLELTRSGEEYAIGARIIRRLSECHESGMCARITQGLLNHIVRLATGIETELEHPPEVCQIIAARAGHDDLAVEEQIACHHVWRLELLRHVDWRPAQAGSLLVGKWLDVARMTFPGTETIRLDDALENRVLPDDRLHGAKDRSARRGREVELW
jgi:hypothetical protein